MDSSSYESVRTNDEEEPNICLDESENDDIDKYRPQNQQMHCLNCCSTSMKKKKIIWIQRFGFFLTIFLSIFSIQSLSSWLYFKWETRQHFWRQGPGPFPTNQYELEKYKLGLRLDWPKMYQKLPTDTDTPPPDQEICFVHVGKSAGSTLSCYLGFLHGRCGPIEIDKHSYLPGISKAPGKLSDAVTHMIHVASDDCQKRDFAYYLFVVRDPFERLQSWFTYERHKHGISSHSRSQHDKLFVDCDYDTLNQLGEFGLADRGEEELTKCQRRARYAITGREKYYYHNYFNYGYYVEQVKRNHPNFDPSQALVIRSEHLEADWRSIEVGILHGNQAHGSLDARHTNLSQKRPRDLMVSELARQQICRYLCMEIQIYKDLLHNAQNLIPADVDISIRQLTKNCPVEAATSTCDIDEEFQRKKSKSDDDEEDDD
jgi:hypothetical protein